MTATFGVEDLSGSRAEVAVPVVVPSGLWIPGWDGPEVGTLAPHLDLPTWTGQTTFDGSDGQVAIEGHRIGDQIFNDGADVVMRNCWFPADGWWGVINDSGTLLLEDSYASPAPGDTSRGQYIFITGNNQTLRRVLIDPIEDGIRTGDNCLYEQVHITAPNLASSYGDAIQGTGGTGVVVSYCLLENEMTQYGNACIIATDDQGHVDDWLIEHSVMVGGANAALQFNEKATCPTDIKLNDVIIDNPDGNHINVGGCPNTITQWDNVRDAAGNPIGNPN